MSDLYPCFAITPDLTMPAGNFVAQKICVTTLPTFRFHLITLVVRFFAVTRAGYDAVSTPVSLTQRERR
ncbi:hypothetical protein HBI46_046680 [Parastagonospora nodorum]|nr:hypothetical protein HBH47_178160 [Parastagonospora nodorum]KAH4916213.1 hypothetical protein HBI79_229050 [Parastagonospora nodorum]KAH5426371.1 hypothetical protein HBI46_046680 [Parastagonospora nodorum]KAH5586089.1 hypothetical protein HBI45_237800 [Parastagonospora nodorum]KAH5711253.1 hypothetical protein HBI20_171840 [Parastagonospora nodorum]